MSSRSNVPKKKVRFLTIGPPEAAAEFVLSLGFGFSAG